VAIILSFELPLNQAIKSLGTEWSSDQGWLSPIKTLDPGRKPFYRRRVCNYPLNTDWKESRLTCRQTFEFQWKGRL